MASSLLSRRCILGAGLVALGGAPIANALAQPQRTRLRLIGEQRLPHRMAFRGTTVGGLSGIDYDPATGLYDLLSDDRSDLQPARLYRARMPLAAQSLAPCELVDVVTLKQADGTPWPNRRSAPPDVAVPDPEAIRRLPDGHFLWTTEGDVPRGFGPAVHQCDPQGAHLRSFSMPDHFRVARTGGPRDNLGFEGLALEPGGAAVWAAMENALAQDGPVPRTDAAGGPCRFTRFDVATGRAVRQIAYVPDAIPLQPVPASAFADNGVSEVLMLDEHRMLVLERAYATGAGNSLRLYRIDTRDASDTLALDTLTAGNHRPAPKALVADFAQLGLARLDNTEGMTWGPTLPGGGRTLVVVSDDNFNPAQVTQLAAFEWIETP